MFKIELEALEHPNPNSINVKDRRIFATTVLWLEDQKIRKYKIKDRRGLRQIDNIKKWEKAYEKYKIDIDAPRLNSTEKEMSWLLSYALRLELPEDYQNILLKEETDSASSGLTKVEPSYHVNNTKTEVLDRLCGDGFKSLERIIANGNSTEVTKHSTKKSSGSKRKNSLPKTSVIADSSVSKSKHILPLKVVHRNRRMAFKLLERYERIPKEAMTEKQKASFAWATKLVANSSKTERPRHKFPTNMKRTCAFAPNSSNKILSGHIILAVIDKSDIDGSISHDRWKNVEVGLATSFLQILQDHPGPVPSIYDSGWHTGRVKLIACADQRSADLYKIAIAKLGEVWPGAQLEVVSREQIPSRPRAYTWIPAEPSDTESILKIIKISNPQLPTHNWTIEKLEEPIEYTRFAVIAINRESLALLANINWEIGYAFGSVTLKIYKNSKKKMVKAVETGTVEAMSNVAPILHSSTPLDGKDDSVSLDMEINDKTDRLSFNQTASDTEKDKETVVEVSVEDCSVDTIIILD